MNARTDLERRLADFYVTEAPRRAPDWLLGAALETIDTTPQRRSRLRLPWTLPVDQAFAKVTVAAVALVAVGAISVAVLGPVVGPGEQPPASSSPETTPAPSPETTPSLLADQGPLPLDAGTYVVGDPFPKPISFETPAFGWTMCSDSPAEQVVCGSGFTDLMPSVSFLLVDNVVAGPCNRTLPDPPVGPSVDDLVAAISSLDGFQATPAVDVTIDGYRGKQFEVTAPSDPVCGLLTWSTAGRINGVAGGEINRLVVLDVDGTRVMLAGAFGASETARPVIEQILDSVRIGP